MLQIGGGLDLGQEPLGAEHRGQLAAQHLERDLAVVPQVVREIDRGHAALAELALDAVAVGQRRGQALVRVTHRGRDRGNINRRARLWPTRAGADRLSG